MKTWMWLLLGGGVAFLLIRSANANAPITGGVIAAGGAGPITEADKKAITSAVHSRTDFTTDVVVTQLSTGQIVVTATCWGGPSRTEQFMTVADAVANAGC